MITKRTTIPSAEALLHTEVRCLDHGFITPVDYMGGDADIVQAARASYGPSTRPVMEDRGLLRYLMRHKHTSPFEMAEVKFLCRMPLFVARQWIRHRTANVNEMSLRYGQPLDVYYVPDASTIAAQSSDNKQGRGLPLSPEDAEEVRAIFLDGQAADAARHAALADRLGVARELARAVLPVSLYTQWVWKIDLHNLLHFLQLRLDPHAQYEIRVFAEAMAGFVRAWVPESWAAFEEYRLNAVTFGATERRALAMMIAQYEDAENVGEAAGLKGGELREFLAKVGEP